MKGIDHSDPAFIAPQLKEEIFHKPEDNYSNYYRLEDKPIDREARTTISFQAKIIAAIRRNKNAKH